MNSHTNKVKQEKTGIFLSKRMELCMLTHE